MHHVLTTISRLTETRFSVRYVANLDPYIWSLQVLDCHILIVQNNIHSTFCLFIVLLCLYMSMAKHLQSYLEEENCFDPFQSGSRPQQGTEMALITLHDDLLRETVRGGITLRVLLHFSMAFDIVNHRNLLDRLGIWGLALVWPFLKGHVQSGQLELSARWMLNCGVPQGSLIFPILLNMHVKTLGEIVWRYGVHTMMTYNSTSPLSPMQCMLFGPLRAI